MSIVARAPETQYETAPEGLHQAVCVDVVDLGDITTEYGTKHKVELRWQIEALNAKGYRFEVRKRYTLSLHERARLRQELQTWRGRKFTEEELRGFDLEKLLGVNCQLQIVHNITDDGRTFANVQAIVPHNAKVPKIAPENYTRQKDRAAAQGNGSGLMNGPAFQDEEVPF